MESIIHLLVFIPIVGFIISLLIPKRNEYILSWNSFVIAGLQFVISIAAIVFWIIGNERSLDIREVSIFETSGYDFYIDFFYDRITAVFLVIGASMTFIITMFSRYYLHREKGYKRFFNVISLFYVGYNIVVLSGNLETLFIGWEILGVSSFLLIAFYRDRYLPVKNAVKVFSVYRIGDVGLIIAMWLSHHLWASNISFYNLENYDVVHDQLAHHSITGFFLSLMLFVSAAAKSAQLPFSSWLPRAMEGPTPSSAIFYGSLAVHIGAFLLLRTFPFWEHQMAVRWLFAFLGILTSIVATFTARVQSSVKSQIAYSSIAQIGLIFLEIALGLEWLALIHIIGNAYLRTYQLLISPSIVSYKIKLSTFQSVEHKPTKSFGWSKQLESTIYLLSLKEWNLDSMMYRRLWNPLKKLGSRWSFLTFKNVYIIFGAICVLGAVLVVNRDLISPVILPYLPEVFAIIGLLMVIKSFTERSSVRLSWSLVITNHLALALAISFNEAFNLSHMTWYLSGVLISGIVGYACVQWLRSMNEWISLDRFYGHSYEHPKTAGVFFLACLGVAGFPITPTFIGEDLLFFHIGEEQAFLAFLVAMSLILNGLSAIRIFARIFLGPHVKNYHEVAKRSS